MAKIRSRDRVRFSMVLEMSQRSAGIIEEIEAEILKGKLLPGERLPSEEKLCERFSASRTVIREAMRQLESEHLIRVVPAQGPIVAVLTEAEIRAIYVVRATLEGLAGRLFALHAAAPEVARMLELGARIGEAFQVADDLRDALYDEATLGKPAGQDAVHARPSAVAELGVQGATRRLSDILGGAIASIPACPGEAMLADLVRRTAERMTPVAPVRV